MAAASGVILRNLMRMKREENEEDGEYETQSVVVGTISVGSEKDVTTPSPHGIHGVQDMIKGASKTMKSKWNIISYIYPNNSDLPKVVFFFSLISSSTMGVHSHHSPDPGRNRVHHLPVFPQSV
jgi:hypothetical protein